MTSARPVGEVSLSWGVDVDEGCSLELAGRLAVPRSAARPLPALTARVSSSDAAP